MNNIKCLFLLLFTISFFAHGDTNNAFSSMDKWYAKQFNVSLEESVKHRVIMDKARKIAPQFEREIHAFSSFSTRHLPRFKVVFEVKKIKYCEDIKNTPAFSKNRQCNISSRIKKSLKKAKILDYSDVVFVEHSKIDQKELQSKASYYANKFAHGNWWSLGWDPRLRKIRLRVYDKALFERKLLIAKKTLPDFIKIDTVDRNKVWP